MWKGESEERRTLVAALMWALVPSFVFAGVAGVWIQDPVLKKLVYTGATTLFFGGFLGGMVKVLLDEHVAAKRRRDDAVGFVTNVLANLKSVYDRTARARIVIPAHRSVKTYGDEMRDLIEARVQLRNVTRALERRADGVEEPVSAEVTRLVRKMETYLETLTSEFRDEYKPLSDQQRGYEERAKVMLGQFAQAQGRDSPPELPRFVWERLSRLPQLSEFIVEGPVYRHGFVNPLDDASQLLRDELARILGAHPAKPIPPASVPAPPAVQGTQGAASGAG